MTTVVLARALTDLPAAVAAVPGPPLPVVDPPFDLRSATPSDAELVAEWMNRPHLAAAWEYDWPVPRWRKHLVAQLDSAYSLPVIASLDGVPGGYLEIYRAAKDSIAACYQAHPHDLGLHAAIANLDLVSTGLGPMLLPAIVASLFTHDPRCERIMFDPDHRNSAARKVCEAVGCRFLGEHEMTNRRMALYAFERPAITP